MNKYKPEYLGKVIPADNPSKLTDFVTNQYDSFSKVYEVCKDQSDKIKDIKVVESDNDPTNALKVKISGEKEVIDKIKEKSKDGIIVEDDVITVTGSD